jgi:hypothetical protein
MGEYKHPSFTPLPQRFPNLCGYLRRLNGASLCSEMHIAVVHFRALQHQRVLIIYRDAFAAHEGRQAVALIERAWVESLRHRRPKRFSA